MSNENDMNYVLISGHLKEVPNIQTSKSNIKFSTFTIISKRKNFSNTEEYVSYIQVVMFGDQNVKKAATLRANDKVLVQGVLNQNLYKDCNNITKESVKIIASSIYTIAYINDGFEQFIWDENKENDKFEDDELPF